MNGRRFRGYLILAVMVVLFSVLSAMLGTASWDDPSFKIIFLNIRLPRMLSALVLGGALSVSGYLLQVFFANPIAGPFVLGISNGAKLTTAFAFIMLMRFGIHLSSLGLVAASFAGAGLVTAAVLAVSRRTRSMTVLVLSGVMTGYICTAVTDFLITFADEHDIANLHSWSMGSFSGMNMKGVALGTLLIAAGMAGAVILSKPAAAYLTGEEYARSAGVDIRRFRFFLIMVSSLLSATVTAFAGPISFVGVAVPHLMRRLFRTTKPEAMIPACFLGGAVFCLLSDLIARLAFSPTELSISSVTAVLGAPVVIMVLMERGRSHE
ncbi:MAG: iron ABC transporter permease [Lachnospiraceae bacterium]|nr:iron ABC transporter permease [Lachnospiraceae bacterium]